MKVLLYFDKLIQMKISLVPSTHQFILYLEIRVRIVRCITMSSEFILCLMYTTVLKNIHSSFVAHDNLLDESAERRCARFDISTVIFLLTKWNYYVLRQIDTNENFDMSHNENFDMSHLHLQANLSFLSRDIVRVRIFMCITLSIQVLLLTPLSSSLER